MKQKLLTIVLLLIMASPGYLAAAVPPPSTKVQAIQCGSVLTSIASTITADNVPGATAYRFRVVTGTQEQTIVRTVRNFKLTMLPSHVFSKTYQVSVAVQHQGVWHPYGPVCNVTTPTPTTKIQNTQCGITLNNLSQIIYCNVVANVNGYRFRITNVLNPAETYIVNRTVREFRMNLIPAQSNTTYMVDVAAKNIDGTYLPFGEACLITTPMLQTQISWLQCGTVLPAMSTPLNADAAPNAIGYRFRVTDTTNPSAVKIIDRTTNSFTMSSVANVSYNRAYKIEVAIRQQNGSYLPYGPQCIITTPKMPLPKIQLAQCDLIAQSLSDLIYADEILGATVYRFKLERIGYSQVIDRNSRAYSLSMFNGLEPSTEYTVRVAVRVNGTFSTFGKACNIVTPGNSNDSRMADPQAEATGDVITTAAFPNPFSETFTIEPATADYERVTISIFDLTGRMLEDLTMTTSECRDMRFGSSYPPGVYTVAITTGKSAKVIRMVKK